MKNLFFYGTLRHVPLLSCVLGRAVTDNCVIPARLSDWAVFTVAEGPFPMICKKPGARAEGVLVKGLSDDDIARLNFYEGGFDYALEPVQVETAEGAYPAEFYLPPDARWTPSAPWSLETWVAAHGPLTLLAAQEVMERRHSTSAEQIDALFDWIRARAWAQMLAQDGAPQTLRNTAGRDSFQIETQHPGYDGFFRIKEFTLRHQRFDGAQSAPLKREAFVAFDAALVLPYDPHTDQVMLVEQLRFGPIWRGDPSPYVLEPIAGLVDAGEAPADCARREAVEEAGIQLGDLQLMTRIYASPGYSTEFFHCYLGLTDLSVETGGIGGKEDENEDIRNHVISFDHAMSLIDTGEINAGPLTMMLLWLARHRDDLRAQANGARP